MPRKSLYKSPKSEPREVEFKRYDDIIVRDDEDFDDEEIQELWNDMADDFPELEDLNDLEDFLEDFEYGDSDKYTEPS